MPKIRSRSPATQTTNQNVDLTFSAALLNPISIADEDAGVSSVRVTLTPTNGTATLNGVTGLTFTTGNGTADPVMVFTGALSGINTALNGLFFSPTTDFIGTASAQIQTNDQGNTGSGGAETEDDTRFYQCLEQSSGFGLTESIRLWQCIHEYPFGIDDNGF